MDRSLITTLVIASRDCRAFSFLFLKIVWTFLAFSLSGIWFGYTKRNIFQIDFLVSGTVFSNLISLTWIFHDMERNGN